MKLFLFLTLLMMNSAFALEVDEKLTVRILRTSETRKTLMVNRGTEDGLVEGDHAKFITTAGIVARAVCIRVSPTRSVWSVYRLVNADFIVNDSVMSIKITPPVKITKDETKTLIQEDTPTTVATGGVAPIGVPLADGAEDLGTPVAGDVATSDADLKTLIDDEPSIIPEKNIEAFGIINIAGLTANTKTDGGDDSFNNSQSYHHIGLGGELYAQREREWYSRWSLVGSLNIIRMNSQSFSGAGVTNDLTEFSIGTNWHPTKLPSATMQFIPYIHLSFNVGTVKSTFKPGIETSGNTEELESNGGSQGFAAGFGYKFYTSRGFGARILLDYYMRSEKYEEIEDSGVKFTKTVGGPRFMIGLGYRF